MLTWTDISGYYLRLKEKKIIYAARQILKTLKKGACFGKNRKKRSEAKKIKETEVNITPVSYTHLDQAQTDLQNELGQ